MLPSWSTRVSAEGACSKETEWSGLNSVSLMPLMIASLNIVSLRKHRHELEAIMNDHKIDILALNETRLKRKVEDREVHIPGYKIYRNDCNIHGGEVALYTKDTLPDPKIGIKSNDRELLCLGITLQQAKSFYLLSWYHPPTTIIDGSSFQSLNEVLHDLDSKDKEIILVEDTNCDFKSDKKTKVKRLYSEYHLEQVITDCTRIAITSTENQRKIVSKSLLDHFSTNRVKYIKISGILELGIIGHFLIFAVRKVYGWRQKTGHRNVIETRNYRKYNKQMFKAFALKSSFCAHILEPWNMVP